MDIHIVNHPDRPRDPAHDPKRLYVDHDTGMIHVPGKEPMPLNGPTSGKEWEDFKKAEAENKVRMNLMERQMRSTYQCTQCKRKTLGAHCRIRWRDSEGVRMEVLTCPDQTCDGPVVMVQDALDLTKAPAGGI